MTILSPNSLDYMRKAMATYVARPLGVLLFTDKEYPNGSTTFSVVVTATTIAITQGSTPFTITYVGKTTRQIASELSNSPFPISVKPLADVGLLLTGELKASGVLIPESFDQEDISNDGRSVIIRCTRYSVTYNKTSAIGLSSPYFEGPQLPWWARITNGKFSQSTKGITYHFGIPEYDQQTWSTFYSKPFMDVEGEPVQFLNSTTIQLSRFPLLYKNNNIVFVNTSSEKAYPASLIKDVDTMNGRVYLKDSTSLSKDVVVYYTYLENSYIYKDIDLNGHFLHNPYILDKYVVFYALPYKSSSGLNRTRTIYHTIGSSIDDAIYKIETNNSLEPIAILGAVNIRQNSSISDITITDTRSYGGGLNTDSFGEATAKRFKESQYFFDIGKKEGIPYPGSAAIVVDLPASLRETMTVSEVRERTQKWVAAGVYPVIRFQDSEYLEQFNSNGYNSDISLVNYTFSTGNNTTDLTLGPTGQVANILKSCVLSCTNGVTSGMVTAPIIQGDVIKLEPGSVYNLSYIKGSADAVFSYEQKTKDGQWERVTTTNTMPVGTGQLSSQMLQLESKYSYKEIRGLTGFSAYNSSDSFWIDLSVATAAIVKLTLEISTGNPYYVQTNVIPDVRTTNINPAPSVAGINYLVEPLLTNYNICSTKNFFSGHPIITGNALFGYYSTTGNVFPRTYSYDANTFGSQYNGSYDALRDLNSYSQYARYSINESLDLGSVAARTQSGAIAIATKVLSISPFTGIGTISTDIITPYYNPSSGTAIRLWTGIETEVTISNNLYLGSNYIKAFSALYASQIAPISGQTTGSNYTPTTINARDLALTGMGYWISYFNTYFSPTLSGSALELNWLTTYNKVSDFAGNILTNLCNGFDNLYYGNKCWAGWTGYETKVNPYGLLPDQRWTGLITWPDASIDTAGNTLSKVINGITGIQNDIAPYIQAQCNYGGILLPGYVDAIASYLWYPVHHYLGDNIFSNLSGDPQPFIDTFELGMSAIINGALNEDGIIIEGGSFMKRPGPFSGTVPSKLFSACADAIKLYRLKGDEYQERKWTHIAEGLFRTTEDNYHNIAGYQFDPLSSSSFTGDPGSVPLKGYIKLLGQYTGQFTSDEFRSITGQIENVLT